MLLDASQIAELRSVAELALPDRATIQRRAEVSDGGGGTTTSWSTHAAEVPCRLSPVGGGEIGTIGGRISDEATSLVTMAAGQDVVESDRLVIGDTTYDVQLVRRRGSWAITTRVECKEAG